MQLGNEHILCPLVLIIIYVTSLPQYFGCLDIFLFLFFFKFEMKRSLDLFLTSVLQTQRTSFTIPVHFQYASSELPARENRRLSSHSTGAPRTQRKILPPALQWEEASFFKAINKFTHQHNVRCLS